MARDDDCRFRQHHATYLDDNTILFGTDFGPGMLTASSYPRIMKIWHRGEPVSAAKTVFEGKTSDVSSQPAVFSGPYGTVPLITRGVSYFEIEYYYALPNRTATKLPLPLDADLKGVTNGNIIFTLRKDWTAPGQTESFRQGSLIAFPVKPFVMQKMQPTFTSLYAPDERGTIDEVSAGRDAVYASIYKIVTGGIHEFRASADGKWTDTRLALPPGGSTRVVSTNDFGRHAYFACESVLKPVTLYAYAGKGAPAEIKSEPARFDANNLVSEQFGVTSADGTKVPYFYIHPKNVKGASRHSLQLWRLRDFTDSLVLERWPSPARHAPGLARQGWRYCGRQHPWRGRVRPGIRAR